MEGKCNESIEMYEGRLVFLISVIRRLPACGTRNHGLLNELPSGGLLSSLL